uniref:Uncharacterized protein n=1 Tax=Anguilla anguilla TaxID=7936 RepID=A0A0E9RMA8_ANGAN
MSAPDASISISALLLTDNERNEITDGPTSFYTLSFYVNVFSNVHI